MIGWILYALGVVLFGGATYLNNGGVAGTLAVLGTGLIIASFIYGLNRLT